ncbi:MAG: hypothetical protein HY318_13320 [Armatimonadetes bacterium]|nr:hypothetical protein [Armatimonadota bacterium]
MQLRAGVSEGVITPPVGIPLLGPQKASTGVHDDLYARVLVLHDGEKSVALICLDLIGLDFGLSEELRAAVQAKTEIDTTLLNCSHTHSAPFTIPWSVQGWEDFRRASGEWRRELVERIADLARLAKSTLRPVTLHGGRAPVQIGFNRRLPTGHGAVMRPNPRGAVVPWVDVLRVDDAADNPIAILFSHAAHPVIVHAASTLISADYPGYAVGAIREHFSESAVSMFAQGCGGNVNAEPLRGGFEAAERAGLALAEAAIKAASGSEPIEPALLRIATKSTELPLQPLPSEEECEKVLRQEKARLSELERSDSAPADQVWNQRDHVLRLRELLSKVQRAEEESVRLDLNLVALGDEWCLLTMNHEVFAEYQLWIESASPVRHNMVWAYTNACETYIPADSAFEHGGYEAAMSPEHGAALAYRYRLALRPGAEGKIKSAITELWEGYCYDTNRCESQTLRSHRG